MYQRIKCFGAVLGALILLLGCDNDINVRAEWGKSIAQTGLRPVYPLRENLFIGDILLFVYNPCVGDAISRAPQTMLLGALPQDQIARAFDTFYGNRPQLPVTADKSKSATAASSTADPGSGSNKAGSSNASKTTPAPSQITVTMSSLEAQSITATSGAPASASPSAAPSSAASPQNSPAVDSKSSIYGSSRKFLRLPMAAIPSISLYSYVGGSVGGLFNGISGAFSGQSSKTIKVSAQQIEVSELPAGAFADIVADFMNSPAHDALMRNMATYVAILNGELAVAGCKLVSNPRKPQIVYVNSVYYTRNLVFEFGEDSAFAAKIAASLPAAASVPSSGFTGPTIPTTGNSTNPAQVSAQSLISGLASMSGGPGAGGSIAMGTSGNLALNQSFARPMAFATQHALFYDLNIATDGMGSEVTGLTSGPANPSPSDNVQPSPEAPLNTVKRPGFLPPPAAVPPPSDSPLREHTVTPFK